MGVRHEDARKTPSVGRHSRQRNKASGQSLRFAMAYLRECNGGAFTKTVIDATMYAIIAWFIHDALDFAGLSSNLAYITACYQLHRYEAQLVRLSNASLLKSRVEDGEINNQRRAFPR